MTVKRPSSFSIAAALFQSNLMAMDKLAHLRDLIRSYGSCLVAYSGGVDSVFLAYMAHEVLATRSLAVIADSASLPRRELADAVSIAERYSIPIRVIATREFDNPDYTSNPVNRCYFCKHELFTQLAPLAKAGGYTVIAYGENASDAPDLRPGSRAAAEFKIAAPLREVGLTKAEIREYSAQLGLPTADKPQMACLSSRIPSGEAVSPAKLEMVERSENVLRDLGFQDVRVRHHEWGGRHLARIELGPDEIVRLFAGDAFRKVAQALREIGYHHVTVDLHGYHRAGPAPA